MMKKAKLSDEQVSAVCTAFRDALDHGPWASSALLRVLGKKLQALYDVFEAEVGSEQAARAKQAVIHHTEKKPAQTEQEVFVSLYSSDGMNMKSWEHIITNLPRQVVSRPVYAEEEGIKQVIRTREKPINEAYVAIYVNKQDILSVPSDRVPKDRQGTPLLTLKDNALVLDHIVRFVHLTGVYAYTRGQLVRAK